MSNHVETNRLVSRPTTILVIIAGVLIFGLPILFDILTSLRTTADVYSAPFSLFFKPTIQSFIDSIQYDLPTALWASVRITGGVVILVMIIALPTAYALARAKGRLRDVGLAMLIVLQLLPATTLVIPLYQVLAALHLLGNIPGVIVASAAYLLPFAVILLRPFFLSVPVEIEEAAEVDGSGRMRTFMQVTLPISRNGVLVVAVLIGMIAWGDFLYPISFLTNPQDYPLSTLLASQVGDFGSNWPRLMALSLIILSPIILIFLLMERRLSAGLSLGAVK